MVTETTDLNFFFKTIQMMTRLKENHNIKKVQKTKAEKFFVVNTI